MGEYLFPVEKVTSYFKSIKSKEDLQKFFTRHLAQEFAKTKLMTTLMIALESPKEQSSFTEITLPELSRIKKEAQDFRQRLSFAHDQKRRSLSEQVTHIGWLMPRENEHLLYSNGYQRLITLYLHTAVSKMCSLLIRLKIS